MKHRTELYFSFLALTAFAFSANTIPPLLTTIAGQIDAPYEGFGWLLTLQYLFFAAAAFWLGKHAEVRRWNNRSLVIVGLLAMCALLWVGGLLSQYWMFMVWILPLGFAGGITETFGSMLIVDLDGSHSSKSLNQSQAFYCLGAITAPLITSLMIRSGYSWRTVLCLIALLIGVIGWLFSRFTARLAHPASNAAPSGEPSGLPNPAAPAASHPFLIHALALMMFLYVFVELTVACWTAAFFEIQYSITAAAAARYLSLFWCGQIVGRLLVPWIPDKWSLWPALTTGSLGMAAVAGAFVGCESQAWAMGLIILFGICAGPIWPTIVTIGQKTCASQKLTARVIAAGALGAALGPGISGRLLKINGFGFFPVVVLACSLVLCLVLIPLLRMRRLRNVQPSPEVPIS